MYRDAETLPDCPCTLVKYTPPPYTSTILPNTTYSHPYHNSTVPCTTVVVTPPPSTSLAGLTTPPPPPATTPTNTPIAPTTSKPAVVSPSTPAVVTAGADRVGSGVGLAGIVAGIAALVL